jgi:hypothetical protein
MQRVKVTQEEIKQNETSFLALRLETKNANIILLSEGEDNLGTLAIAVPQKEKMLGAPLSSVLLGDRNMITARFLAENLAQKTGKLALTSVFAKTLPEKDAGSIFLKLFEKTLKAKEEGEEKL